MFATLSPRQKPNEGCTQHRMNTTVAAVSTPEGFYVLEQSDYDVHPFTVRPSQCIAWLPRPWGQNFVGGNPLSVFQVPRSAVCLYRAGSKVAYENDLEVKLWEFSNL